MTVDELIKFIGTTGFPVVMCCGLSYVLYLVIMRYTKQIDDLRKAIEHNTNVMSKLLAKIEKE